MLIKTVHVVMKLCSGARRASAPSPLDEGLGFTIRLSYPADEASLRRLAALDSQPPPTGRLLLAEVGGDLWAAVSITGERHVIADTFHRTAALVTLLQHQADVLARPGAQRPVPQPAPSVIYS
jgi:hypothetical protein